MAVEIEITCPLGSECEAIVGKVIKRCAWYTCLSGHNPQTGEMIDDWKCAITWNPIMLVENANTNRGQTAAVESLRNETVLRQDAALSQMTQARLING